MAPPRGSASSTVLDVSNPVDVTTGNIYLKTGYHQDISLSVSHGSRRSGRSYVTTRLSGSMDFLAAAREDHFSRRNRYSKLLLSAAAHFLVHCIFAITFFL